MVQVVEIEKLIRQLEKGKFDCKKKLAFKMEQEITATGDDLFKIKQDISSVNESIEKYEKEICDLKNDLEKGNTNYRYKKFEIKKKKKPSRKRGVKYSAKRKLKRKDLNNFFSTLGDLNLSNDNEIEDFKELTELVKSKLESLIDVDDSSQTIISLPNQDDILALYYKVINSKELGEDLEAQIQHIRSSIQKEEKKFKWYDRSLIINSLTLSLFKTYDPKKIMLLIDFLTDEDERVWKRSLVGLVLSLHKNQNKLWRPAYVEERLKGLRGLIKIQEGLFKIETILREKLYEHTLSFTTVFNDPFFKKMHNFFLPFYPENKRISSKLEGIVFN